MKYQYKVEKMAGPEKDLEEKMVFLGQNGWELVSVVYDPNYGFYVTFWKKPRS